MGEISNHQQGALAGCGGSIFGRVHTQVGVHLLILGVEHTVFAGEHDGVLFAQMNEIAVVIENRIIVRQFFGGVNVGVPRVHLQPRGAGRKARIVARIPLHGGSRIIPTRSTDVPQHILGANPLGLHHVFTPGIMDFKVVIVIYRVEENIGHTQLFTLIDVRRSLHHVQNRAEHLTADLTELGGVIAET